MATFVLIHGAWHGGWCWDRLVPELKARGHDSVVMDLPAEDGTATLDDYAAVVLESAAHLDGPGVVVGHSLGALTAPIVAARRPTQALVLLCGVTPNLHGMPWDDAPPMNTPGVYDGTESLPGGASARRDAESATKAFYSQCTEQDAAWAAARIRPQNSTGIWAAPYPLTAWPDVPTHAICCTGDDAITAEFVTATVRDRFGIEATEIPGDHSPFLRDPAGLADLLHSLV
jgi:pimeloyl-ACP methyl ester carboxylesterase